MMREIILDGATIADAAALHARLAELLELPEHYGANLDALWDALTGYIALPLTIRWLDYEATCQRLGSEPCERLLQVLREAEEELPGLQVIVT